MSDDLLVQDALAAWRAISPERIQPEDPTLWIPVGLGKLPVPNPQGLPAHDLHHLILGHGTDLWGEIAVSAFELRTGPPNAFIWGLCLLGVAAGIVLAPRLTWRTWRDAAGWRNAYGLDVHGWTVGEVRERLAAGGRGAG